MDIFKKYSEVFGSSPSNTWCIFLEMIDGKSTVPFTSLNDIVVAEILICVAILCRYQKQENGRTDEKIEKLLSCAKYCGVDLNIIEADATSDTTSDATSDLTVKATEISPTKEETLEEIHAHMFHLLAAINQCVYLMMLILDAEQIQKTNPDMGLDLIIPVLYNEYIVSKKYEQHIWIRTGNVADIA